MNITHGLWLAASLSIAAVLTAPSGFAQTAARIEQTDPAITYTGTWRTIAHPALSGGSIAASDSQGATASITFTGTSIGLISYFCPCGGIARVLVDGVPAGSWNAYSPTPYAQQDFLRFGNLSPGQHTVTVEVLHLKADASSGFWFGVDAFEINPQYDSAPIVALTSPAEGFVSGKVTLTAEASDNTTVTKVEFYANATLLGTDTAAPWSITRDTAGIRHGSTYTLTAVAYDPAGRTGNSDPVEVTVTQNNSTDVTPPFIEMTAPENGSIVTGVVTLSAAGDDDVGITRVDFITDSGFVIGSDTTEPWSITRDTSSLPSGATYTLYARAFDAAGNSFRSTNGHRVTVSHGDGPPQVEVVAPAPGSTVSGTIHAAANVTGAPPDHEVILNGTRIVSPPYETLIDTTYFLDGEVNISAQLMPYNTLSVLDSDASRVTVDNRVQQGKVRVNDTDPALVYTGTWNTGRGFSNFGQRRYHWDDLTVSSEIGATVTYTFEGTRVRWLAEVCDTCGLATVSIDGGAGQQVNLNSSRPMGYWGSSGVYLSPLMPYGTHTIRIRVDDKAVTIDGFEVMKTSDVTAPTAMIDAREGDTLTGVVTLRATASDDIGITKVQFYGNGLLGEDTTAPYSISWDSRHAPNAETYIYAIAIDGTGNRSPTSTVDSNGRTQSKMVLVNHWNGDGPAPFIDITSPAQGATVSGILTVTAEAFHPDGIKSWGFNVTANSNGQGVHGATDTTAPYSATWDTRTVPDGVYTIHPSINAGAERFIGNFIGEPVQVVVDN